MTPSQQAALERLVALMEVDPRLEEILAPAPAPPPAMSDIERRMRDQETARAQRWRDTQAADHVLWQAGSAMQAEMLPGDRPGLVDRELVTGPLRDQLLRWLPSVRNGLTTDRRAAFDDVGRGLDLAHHERVLTELGFSVVVERWQYEDTNGDMSVVLLDPVDGIVAEINTRHPEDIRIDTTRLTLYCNYIAHDAGLAWAAVGGTFHHVMDEHGPTGVWVIQLDSPPSIRVTLALMRAVGEFVRPWQEPAISGWFGGDTSLARIQPAGVTDRAEVDRLIRRLRRLTAVRIDTWPAEVHELLGPIHGIAWT